MTRLGLIIRKPRRYLPLAFKYALATPLRLLSYLFSRSGFRLQQQMDIHPRSTWYNRTFADATGAFRVPDDSVERRILNTEPWDLVRRDMLVLLMRGIVERDVPGDLVELGVYQGRTARLIHHYLPDRTLHLFDTFEGFGVEDLDSDTDPAGECDVVGHYADTSVERVSRRIAPVNGNLQFHAGHFPDSMPASLARSAFAFVHLDADLYTPTLAGLETFYPLLSPGGVLVVHDYNAWPGARRAVDEYFADRAETPVPLPDKNGSAVIIKPTDVLA